MSDAATRSPASLVLRSTLAALWFALWFFCLIPAAVLWVSGELTTVSRGALAAGAALVVLAHLVVAAPVRDFIQRGRGTQAPFDPPRELIASGLYRYVRNPMYLVYVLVVTGEALLLRSPALAVYAAVFAGLAHLFVTRVEEPGLRRRFGEAYDGYCRRVPRWLPHLARADADAERAKAMIRRIYREAYSGGDESLFAELYAPDFLHHNKTIHDVGSGPEAERLSMLRFRQAIPDARFTILDQIAEGDRVANRLLITGTPVAEFPPIQPTGEPIEIHAVAIFRIADGKVAEEWFYRES